MLIWKQCFQQSGRLRRVSAGLQRERERDEMRMGVKSPLQTHSNGLGGEKFLNTERLPGAGFLCPNNPLNMYAFVHENFRICI
jgi:hypothetical protein